MHMPEALWWLTVRVQRTELASGSDSQATAEKEGRAEVSHRLLAGGGESRRPWGASNPPRVRVRWNEVSGLTEEPILDLLDPRANFVPEVLRKIFSGESAKVERARQRDFPVGRG